jgi:CRISPR/Cas system-associated protein Csx1
MDNIVKQFNNAWPEIKAELEKAPHWKRTQGFGYPKYYFQLAEEYKQDIKKINQELALFRQIKANNRDDIEIRRQVEKIIVRFLQEKEEVRCIIKRLVNTGTKQKSILKNAEKEEKPSFLPE